MAFEEIHDQKRAIRLLTAELRSGWVPHAHLFLGPGGVGRLKLARRMAAILLCREVEADRCENCKSCHAFSTGNHPDYFEVGVPEGRQSLPIGLIRGDDKSGQRGLQEEAALKPVLSGRRVFVVRDTELMTVEASNCFLKTLEEPPGESYFILIASGLQQIPDTIVSRCRLIKMSALPVEDVADTLCEEGADPSDAWWLARRTWGSPGRARQFRDVKLPETNRHLVEELLALQPGDNFRMAEWVRKTADDRADSSAERRRILQEVLECIVAFYRDAAVSLLDPNADMFNEQYRDQLVQYAAENDIESIVQHADTALDALKDIGANANQRLALVHLFTRLAC